MTATTTDTMTPSLLAGLRTKLRGEVVAPGDDGYDAARQAWNLNADHQPAVVVLPEDAVDVQTAVRFAVAAGLGVGVMATGHGTGVPSDGGLLINTSRMRGVAVDPVSQVATVGAGTLWQDVITAAAAHGLAGLPGTSPTVGVVGYTLGGGFGWLGRRYGLAAHSITRAEVVTGDGRRVVASPDQNADLFWGLQGGTGNFGVVTSLEFALHPVRDVYAGNLYYPLDRARDLLEFYADWSRSLPLDLTSAVTFRRFPPMPSLPEPLRGASLVALRGCFCGDPDDGAALIDQARQAIGPAAVDTFAVMPAADLAAVSSDPPGPLGVRSHLELLPDLTAAAIDVLVALAGADARSPLVMLEVRQLGGALSGPPGALSPMAHTEARFSVNAIGLTADSEQACAVRQHLERLAAGLGPHAAGETYLNFLDLAGATPARIRAAYSAADWDRLLRLKATYDPENVFRFNRNIAPALPSTTEGTDRPGTN